MAKQRGAVGLIGKIDGVTYTDGKNGKRARKSAEFTEKQKDDARKRPQVKRTGLLNGLGSPLRHAIMHYNHGTVDSEFWQNMLKAFRKEKTDHRVLLLKKIVDLEVDPDRKFIESCPVPPIIIKTTARQYVIDADISKPAIVEKDYNCYFLQFIFVVWNKHDNSVRHMEEQTDWMNPKDRSPKFTTIKFSRTAADTEWVLVCRLVQGVNSHETEYVTDCRNRIIATGTVSPESEKILKQRAKEEEAKKNEVNDMPVVKVKKKLVVRDKL